MMPGVTSLDNVIEEIFALRKALPLRPSLQDLRTAILQIDQADGILASQLQQLSTQLRPDDVLPSLFVVLQEMRKDVLEMEAKQLKRHAEDVIQLEQRHRRYDDLIQSTALASQSSLHGLNGHSTDSLDFIKGENVLVRQNPDGQNESLFSKLSNPQLLQDSGTDKVTPEAGPTRSLSPPSALSGGFLDKRQDNCTRDGLLCSTEPANLSASIAICNLSENHGSAEGPPKVSNSLNRMAVKDGFKSLDLSGVFLRELEWIPESLGHLTWLTQLNLSGNLLVTLPDSIGGLASLTRLDVGANRLVSLPDTIGKLTALVTLTIEKNRIEELPWSIGQCKGLTELRADFNELKELPEAIGNLTNLRILTLHLNCLKSLPTTMAAMNSLMELDVHFNQLESVPDNLCLLTSLVRLNLSSNFISLKDLPQSIGRLQMLKDLDISFNHLTVLPDSFALLTRLQELNLEGNPLKLPPLHIASQGKEAVLNFMVDHVTQRKRELLLEKKRCLLTKFTLRIMRLFMNGNSEVTDDLQIRA